MDYAAVGTAIAARFVGISPPTYTWYENDATSTSATDDALVVVTATLPNQLGPLPALYVMPPVDDLFEWGPSMQMILHQTWTVRMVRSQDQDIARRMAALNAWRPLLITPLIGNIQLGLAYVEWCFLRGSRIAEWTYAEIPHDVVELTIETRIRETVSAAA